MAAHERLRFPVGFERFTVAYLLEHDVPLDPLPATPPAPPPTAALPANCPTCWGQRRIWEPSPLGFFPVVCDGCSGTGRA